MILNGWKRIGSILDEDRDNVEGEGWSPLE